MIDTHCHLNFPPLLENIDEIIVKSKKASVKGVVVVSSNLQDSKVSVDLAKKYPGFLYASVGIHPQTVSSQLVQLDQDAIFDRYFRLMAELVKSNHDVIVAIGETGLDFSEGKTAGQEELFLGQIKLAQKYNLALIIHAREANDEIIEILQSAPRHPELVSGSVIKPSPVRREQGEVRGVFHCYSGGKKRISKILDLPRTWYFGFDGNLTYDEGLQQIIKLIPVERIVIETDSPYLSPLPYRGQENSPTYLPLIQQKVNELFGRDLTSQILQNSKKLFKI